MAVAYVLRFSELIDARIGCVGRGGIVLGVRATRRNIIATVVEMVGMLYQVGDVLRVRREEGHRVYELDVLEVVDERRARLERWAERAPAPIVVHQARALAAGATRIGTSSTTALVAEAEQRQAEGTLVVPTAGTDPVLVTEQTGY